MFAYLSRIVLHVQQRNLPRLSAILQARSAYAVTLLPAKGKDYLALLSLCDPRTEQRLCLASLDVRTGRVRCW